MNLRRPFQTLAEGPLLVLALVVVAAICLPLIQIWTGGEHLSLPYSGERLARLLLGPEQLLCYACFTWALLILLSRVREVRRQRRALDMDLLPMGADLRLLPEDARLWQRRVHQLSQRGGPFLLGHWLELALGKFSISQQASDVRAIISAQADLESQRLSASMARVNYLAWAIPALGFIGTARGIGMTLSVAPALTDATLHQFLDQTTRSLAVTFDTTLVALVLSLFLMYLIHGQSREEELLVLDCQQYCVEQLESRLCVLDAPTHGDSLAGRPELPAYEVDPD